MTTAEQRIVAAVLARPGMTSQQVREAAGVTLHDLTLSLAALRRRRVLASPYTLVPLAGGPAPELLTDKAAELYAWTCDVGGTAHEYAEVIGASRSAVGEMVKRLRDRGFLAPFGTVWTSRQVTSARDAGWRFYIDEMAVPKLPRRAPEHTTETTRSGAHHA